MEEVAGQHLPQPCAQDRDGPPRRSVLRDGSISDAAVEEAERHLSDYLSRSAASSRPATPSICASSADAAMRNGYAFDIDKSKSRGFSDRDAQPGIFRAIPHASGLDMPADEHVFVYPAGTAMSKNTFETNARPELSAYEARGQTSLEVGGSHALSSYLNSIHKVLDRHDTDLRSLWRDLPHRDPLQIDRGEPEQTVCSRACSQSSRPAQSVFRHETSELESGCAALLQRCQDTQRCERANMTAASLAFCALKAEKSRAEAAAKNLLAITASKQQCASDLEARALAAQHQLLLLAQKCSDAELKAVEPVLIHKIGEHLRAETRECFAEVSELEVRESSLQEELASAEQHAQETERKALGLLRDLWEASQSLAKKRNEYESQLCLRRELELSRQEEGALAQRALVQSYFREPQQTQDLAVREALQAAWQAETIQHHQAAEELRVLEESWEATRRSLIPISSTLRRWRSDLGCQREAPSGAVDLSALCRCLQACALESHRRQRAVPGSDLVSSLSASPQRDSAALF